MTSEWVVAVGNFVDGVSFYGPFKNHADALHWAETETSGEPWHLIELMDPEEEL